VELEDLHKCVARVESERAAKARQLSWSVMLMFDALVNLVVFPIRDIREVGSGCLDGDRPHFGVPVGGTC
jgi:hypothetical protein